MATRTTRRPTWHRQGDAKKYIDKPSYARGVKEGVSNIRKRQKTFDVQSRDLQAQTLRTRKEVGSALNAYFTKREGKLQNSFRGRP